MRSTGIEALVVCAWWAASVLTAAGDVVLVKDGAARAVIALPSQPAEHEKLAATELANALREMSGATVATAVVDRADVEAFAAARKQEGVVPVFIGANVADALRPDILARGSVEGAFIRNARHAPALRVQPGRAQARHRGHEGVLPAGP